MQERMAIGANGAKICDGIEHISYADLRKGNKVVHVYEPCGAGTIGFGHFAAAN